MNRTLRNEARYMNYNRFYNSWKNYTQSTRQLLLEAESTVHIRLNPADFLKLTTTAEDMQRISNRPSFSEPYDPIKAGSLSLAINLDDMGIGKVREHEGRNRAYKAIEAGLTSVPVQILVLNRKASINDINELEGQFSSNVAVDRSAFAERELKVDANDPLGIGASKSIEGYDIVLDWDQRAGIKAYINDRYNKEPAFQVNGRVAFINNVLNKLYGVNDNTGQEYIFANSANLRINKETGELTRSGLLDINLNPNPLTLITPPNLDEINARVFTIYKR